jgi:hypothetical protein
MKRITLLLLLVLGIGAVAGTAAQGATTPPPTEPFGVGFNRETGECGLFATIGGTTYDAGFVPPHTGTFKLNMSADGKVLFQCKSDLRSPPPTQTLVINSDRSTTFACWNGTGFSFTTDWQIVLTPSGKAFFNCHADAGT